LLIRKVDAVFAGRTLSRSSPCGSAGQRKERRSAGPAFYVA